MDNKEIKNFLAALLQKSGISAASAEKISEKVAIHRIKSNTVLLAPGKICSHAYLIIKGGFVCRYMHEKFEIAKTINFYLEDLHPFMACVDSFFTQQPTQCELRAIEDSIILSLSQKDIFEIMDKDENLKKYYDSLVITALTEENELKLKIIAFTSEQLYEDILLNFPSVIQKVPSKYIAEFMGISAEWLSKLKRAQK